MGVSMDQVEAGVLATSKVVNESMDIWDRIQQSIRPHTTVAEPAQSTAPAVADRALTQAPPATGAGLLSGIAPWAIVVGAGLLIWRLAK